MYFQTLQSRLVAAVRMRVRTGELTERRLARLTGISQPHIHNVLKGARELSPEIADLILRQLKISLLDLVEGEELDARASLRQARGSTRRRYARKSSLPRSAHQRQRWHR